VDYETDVISGDTRYHPRAVGRLANGMWQGWLEFLPDRGGEVVVTGTESTQPEREHLVYWATGLTPVYLEGALERALRPQTIRMQIVEEPASTAPAERVVTQMAPRPEAVLDPFEIGRRSLDVLRQELSALNRPRLMNIIAAFDLNPAGNGIDWMTDAQLVTFIVTAVDAQLLQRQH
jgi:hypothetical protein